MCTEKRQKGGLILKLEHWFKNFTMKGIATDLIKQEQKFMALEIGEKIMIALCDSQRQADTKK